jgi:poly(3-hydroxybutyrate) depolymerase
MRVVRFAVVIAAVLFASAVSAQNTAPPPLEPNPRGPLFQRTGEQYRVYDFPGTGESIPYRLFVPSRWKPGVKMPLLVTLRAGTSVNNSYREPNSLVAQAEKRGYLVVTPMGYRPLPQPYYGSSYKIARPNAATPASGWTAQENERAEQDVINVIDLVSKEYGIDPARVFLHGQNPSGSGALHLGAKYPDRFAALVISSAPIDYAAYPFDRIKGKMGLMVIHGDQDTTNPIEASQKMAAAAKAAGVTTVYATVPGGTHLAAYLTFAAEIFDFLDTQKKP